MQRDDREPPRLADVAAADGRLARSAAERSPTAFGATASPTSSCSAWADRASRRRCCARCSASRRAGRAFTCSTRPTRPRSGPRPRRPSARSTSWRASRARRSSRTRSPPISGARLEDAGVTRWADHFVAITDQAPRSSSRARAERLPRPLRQSVGHRRPLLGAVVLRPRAGGADGPERAPRCVGWGLAMLAAVGAGLRRSRGRNPAVGLGLAMGAAARAGRDKLTLVVPHGARAVRALGRTADRREHRQARHRRRADCRRAARRRRRATAPIGCSCACGCTARTPKRCATPTSAISRRPARRWPRSSCRSRRRSAPSSSAGRSPRPSPARCSSINPFDEPNVQQAKDATRALLDRYKANGRLPLPARRSSRCRRRRADAEPRARATALDGPRRRKRCSRCSGRATTSRCSRTSDPTRRSPTSCTRSGVAVRDRTRVGDDVRLRPALSAFDRPAPQGRPEHRRVRRSIAATPREDVADSR